MVIAFTFHWRIVSAGVSETDSDSEKDAGSCCPAPILDIVASVTFEMSGSAFWAVSAGSVISGTGTRPIVQLSSSCSSEDDEELSERFASAICAFVNLLVFFGGGFCGPRDFFAVGSGLSASVACFLGLRLYGMLFGGSIFGARHMASGRAPSRGMLALPVQLLRLRVENLFSTG